MSEDLDLVILKNIITSKKHALDFVNECSTDLFSTEVWNFATVVLGHVRTYKDVPTLKVITEKLEKGNNKKLVETISNIWQRLEKVSVDEREYKYNLEKIKTRFSEKQLLNAKSMLTKLEPGSIDVGKTIGELQKTIQNIKSLHQVKTFERKTLKDAVSEFREEYDAKLKNPDFDAGIMTGYSYFDYVTDGLRPGELVLIGGESGTGKSMLLMNMALQIWLGKNNIDMIDMSEEGRHKVYNFTPGNHVLYFSLEMPFKPCRNRVFGRLSDNQTKLIRSAKLNPFEMEKLRKTLRFIKNYPYHFEIVDIPRGATMESLELLYEESHLIYDPKIIVIDYLGLMDYEGGKDMDDWLKLGKIAEKIHEFARVHNCIVLSAVQLNRNKGTKEEDKIGLHRIGRSALIMQNANIAVQIETRANEKSHPDMIYHLIKNRDGELGSGRLIKNLACGTLLDDKIDEDPTTFEMRNFEDISDRLESLDF